MGSVDELILEIISLVAQLNWQHEEIEKLKNRIKEL
uniref:Uncharacterized protein n=1 Tax=Siphoviridae sp. ctrpg19 TaxID=2826481 RepID=A0A8S5MKA9_9CAUD|nr:MAG TPA: hypothetical protein [Siphoviridae sp. ctrpg19]